MIAFLPTHLGAALPPDGPQLVDLLRSLAVLAPSEEQPGGQLQLSHEHAALQRLARLLDSLPAGLQRSSVGMFVPLPAGLQQSLIEMVLVRLRSPIALHEACLLLRA